MNLILGITGASGSIYAKRLIDLILEKKITFDKVALIFTETGQKVWEYEIEDMPITQIPLPIYNNNDFFNDLASGSSDYDAMVVCPTSIGTLSKIANSVADNLLTRAADVMLKENRKLILVPRETPLNLIHLENMKKIILAGGIICPAMPSFYSKPLNITQLVDTVIQKILQQLNFDIKLYYWQKNNI